MRVLCRWGLGRYWGANGCRWCASHAARHLHLLASTLACPSWPLLVPAGRYVSGAEKELLLQASDWVLVPSRWGAHTGGGGKAPQAGAAKWQTGRYQA